ncbi:hypothetical protein [Leptospira interrogans]|uniref:hypothetical protein n=1 Tax=Leptospira interrogans TaxID=173 RepID=UPI00178869C6|nr:hypothetical protein [Leptospira interrogans]
MNPKIYLKIEFFRNQTSDIRFCAKVKTDRVGLKNKKEMTLETYTVSPANFLETSRLTSQHCNKRTIYE